MKSTNLIHIDHVIHFRRLSEKFNEKHFEVVFADIVIEYEEKPRNFWELFFSSPELIPIYKLKLKAYIKEGVGWYCAKDLERVSVDEEMALNHLFKALDNCIVSQSKMQEKIQKMYSKLSSQREKDVLIPYILKEVA